MALKGRRLTSFEAVWARAIADEGLVDAALRYRAWHERGQPVTSAFGEIGGGGDQDRRFAEYDLMKRAEAEVFKEFGTLGHGILHGAVLNAFTAGEMADKHMFHMSRADLKALGAQMTRQRLHAIKCKHVKGLLLKALQVVYDVFNENRR
jgi:hypothetical protein